MRISQRSWHLRVARWCYGPSYEPRDLCHYFWAVVCACVGPILVAGIVGVSAGMLLLLLVALTFQDPLRTLSIVLAGLAGAPLYWFVRGAVRAVRAVRARRQPPLPHEPNLVWQYLKAKQRRLCPLIEVVP